MSLLHIHLWPLVLSVFIHAWWASQGLSESLREEESIVRFSVSALRTWNQLQPRLPISAVCLSPLSQSACVSPPGHPSWLVFARCSFGVPCPSSVSISCFPPKQPLPPRAALLAASWWTALRAGPRPGCRARCRLALLSAPPRFPSSLPPILLSETCPSFETQLGFHFSRQGLLFGLFRSSITSPFPTGVMFVHLSVLTVFTYRFSCGGHMFLADRPRQVVEALTV